MPEFIETVGARALIEPCRRHKGIRRLLTSGVAIPLVFALTRVAMASSGDVDTTFGVSGVARSELNDSIGDFSSRCRPLVQPDGKILFCGTRSGSSDSGFNVFVVRFTPEGHLDPSFSFDGKVTIDFDGGGGNYFAGSLALQADGKIVVVGSTQATPTSKYDFGITRLLDNGELDPQFGVDGKKLIAFDLNGGDGQDMPADVAIQADGKIVVAGSVETATNGLDFGIVRLLSDGSPDSSFNLTGKVVVGLNLSGSDNFIDGAARVAIDSQGRILVAGASDRGAGNVDYSIVRLKPSGALDPNFNGDGRASFSFDIGARGNDQVFGMTIQRDGKIVLCGEVDVSQTAAQSFDIGVLRLQPDGDLDQAFGFSGKTLVSFDLIPNGFDFGVDVIEQANGRLDIAGGAASPDNVFKAAIVQLKTDGSPDASFGTLGKRTYDFGLTSPGSQAFLNLGLQGTHFLVSGFANVPAAGGTSTTDSFIVRLADDTLFATDFEGQ